jgi:thioredoxin reductase
MENRDGVKPRHFEYLIIGAGPAGLQLGYFLQRAERDYQILEGGDAPGTFFTVYPRHRQLISTNKVFTGFDDPEVNLRWDWNSLLSDDEELLLKNYSQRYFPEADVLVDYLKDFAQKSRLKIEYGVRAVEITKKDGAFTVLDQNGNLYSCLHLIMAVGTQTPYVPQIPGIELVEKYTEVSVNPDDFINQKVLVIGKGNSGFEVAENLTPTAAVIHLASPHPVNMAWRTHFVGHVRAVNNNILDTYQLKSQNAVIDASIEKIERLDGKLVVSFNYTHAGGEQEDLTYDRVILATGFRMDESIFDETCRPAMVINNRFPDQTSEWESTNVEGLYFAGTLMQVRDFKKTTSGFIHGFRYNVRALHRIFESKFHGQPWPSRELDAMPEALVGEVIRRVNVSSALWQQFGFICDLIVVSEDGASARYFEEVPVGYIGDSDFGRHKQYYTVTLEYGPAHAFADPFNITRIERHDVENASQSTFLHPIVRRFSGSELVSEHHIIEDFAAQWLEDVHIQPLQKYFSEAALSAVQS